MDGGADAAAPAESSKATTSPLGANPSPYHGPSSWRTAAPPTPALAVGRNAFTLASPVDSSTRLRSLARMPHQFTPAPQGVAAPQLQSMQMASPEPSPRVSSRAASASRIAAQSLSPQSSIATYTPQPEPQKSIARLAPPSPTRATHLRQPKHAQSKRWHSNAYDTRSGNGRVSKHGPARDRPRPVAGMTRPREIGARRGLLGPVGLPAQGMDEPQAKRDRRALCPSGTDEPRAQAG